MTTSLLVDGSSPDKCERRRANSDTPATPAPTSSIPEWRKEGLGEELIEALERIERDSPQTHEPVKPKPRNLGSWLFGDSRAHRAKHWSSKDERKAEKRREKERAELEEQMERLREQHAASVDLSAAKLRQAEEDAVARLRQAEEEAHTAQAEAMAETEARLRLVHQAELAKTVASAQLEVATRAGAEVEQAVEVAVNVTREVRAAPLSHCEAWRTHDGRASPLTGANEGGQCQAGGAHR